MGQAKRRGSYEKRKAESILREAKAFGGGLGMAIAPVEPDVLIHLFGVGAQAGLSAAEGATITADSVSRALQAAIKTLSTLPVEGKEAYLARLSCLRPIFDSGRFNAHFQQSADGHVFVENALLRAMAVAACTTRWDDERQCAIGQFDLDALAGAIGH